jgi:hypothetical protein
VSPFSWSLSGLDDSRYVLSPYGWKRLSYTLRLTLTFLFEFNSLYLLVSRTAIRLQIPSTMVRLPLKGGIIFNIHLGGGRDPMGLGSSVECAGDLAGTYGASRSQIYYMVPPLGGIVVAIASPSSCLPSESNLAIRRTSLFTHRRHSQLTGVAAAGAPSAHPHPSMPEGNAARCDATLRRPLQLQLAPLCVYLPSQSLRFAAPSRLLRPFVSWGATDGVGAVGSSGSLLHSENVCVCLDSWGEWGACRSFFFACLASLYHTYSVGSPWTLSLHNALLGMRSALTRESVVLYALGHCPPLHTRPFPTMSVSSRKNCMVQSLTQKHEAFLFPTKVLAIVRHGIGGHPFLVL